MRRIFSIRVLLLSLNICLLGVALVMWWRSAYVYDGIYRVQYLLQVSPQQFFLQSIESDDGRIMFRQCGSTCLTVAERARGTSSEFGDLGMERKHVGSANMISVMAWRSKRLEHILFGHHSIWNRLGFYHHWGLGYHNATWQEIVVIPYWAVVVLLAVWPMIAVIVWAVHLRRHLLAARRRAQGRCTTCGYDLRASVGRCPECGMPTEEDNAHGAG